MTRPSIPTTARALNDPGLRTQRWEEARRALSVLELNRLIWRISKWEECTDRLPYLDPTYGGVDADVVLLLKAPQADADPARGAGRLISLDNDDEVAATLFDLFRELGIDRGRCVAWNLCPFPLGKFDPDATEIAKGKRYFKHFIELIHHPRSVLVLGRAVEDGWKNYSFGDVVPEAKVVFGPSPSPPGINRPGNRDVLRNALIRAFGVSRETDAP